MRPVTRPPKLSQAGVERALQRLRHLVRQRGLKASAVRESIARTALAIDGHFSIEDLLKALPGSNTATIYRVIPLLIDAGLLQSAPALKGEVHRYERAFEREHHDHLVCTHCGDLVEFHFESLEALQRDVARRFGFTLTSHRHELFGTCTGCRKKSARG